MSFANDVITYTMNVAKNKGRINNVLSPEQFIKYIAQKYPSLKPTIAALYKSQDSMIKIIVASAHQVDPTHIDRLGLKGLVITIINAIKYALNLAKLVLISIKAAINRFTRRIITSLTILTLVGLILGSVVIIFVALYLHRYFSKGETKPVEKAINVDVVSIPKLNESIDPASLSIIFVLALKAAIAYAFVKELSEKIKILKTSVVPTGALLTILGILLFVGSNSAAYAVNA